MQGILIFIMVTTKMILGGYRGILQVSFLKRLREMFMDLTEMFHIIFWILIIVIRDYQSRGLKIPIMTLR